uniref:PIN-like protein n=1 Tax=Kalanchoe fedtschenkoi TaxID=63787 RepID=A0A7N0UBE9_KALFE
MISLADVYHVVSATVPLYVVMILAYLSVRWWKIFTPDQCVGINRFVAKYSIPLLAFQLVSENNPFKMNLKLILSDVLQKVLAGVSMLLAVKISGKGDMNWVITGISVSTLPNSLIFGIPLLKAMYGDEARVIVLQFVVLQSALWYNVLLFLFEMSTKAENHEKRDEGEVESQQEMQPKDGDEEAKPTVQKSSRVVLSLLKVGGKLAKNPNTHATIAGLIWASIRFRWGVAMPQIVNKSITILSDGGLGMAMFSIGTIFINDRNNFK